MELAGIGKMGDGAVELQPPSAMGAGQLLEEAAAEQAGEDLDGGQEGAAPGLPLAAVDIEAGIGRHHVQMRMEEQLLVPGMETVLQRPGHVPGEASPGLGAAARAALDLGVDMVLDGLEDDIDQGRRPSSARSATWSASS